MLLQQVISGIAIGSIYALIALGFVLIYKASEIVNFAHGDMIMFIAFCAYTFLVQYKMNYLLSFVLTIFCGSLLGILLQRIIVSPLIRAPVISVVIATLAISIILRNLAGLIWTHEIVFFPSGFSEKPVNFSGLVVAQSHIWFIVISLALMSLLFLFFKFTKIGTAMRAASENQVASRLMGINPNRIFLLIWAISGTTCGVVAMLITPIVFLDTNMGAIAIRAFAAAVLGGFGSIPGAIVGGIILGVMENLAATYFPSFIKNSIPFLILIAVLFVKPSGIFGIHAIKKV